MKKRRKILYIFFTILLNILTSTTVFSDQIAITKDGREVLLRRDGTWMYIKEEVDKLKLKCIAVNEEVKDSLHYYIYNDPNMFVKEFNLGIGIINNLPYDEVPYDEKYWCIMEMLYEIHYKERHPEEFYSVLVRKFGKRTADNMRWFFQNWELCEKVCK